MSDHKTTFNYVQKGNARTARLTCDTCDLTMEIDCLKLSTRMAEREFYLLHEKTNPTTLKSVQTEIREKKDRKITTNPVLTPDELRDLNKPKKEKVEADFKKPRSTKKLAEQQKKVQKIYEKDDMTPGETVMDGDYSFTGEDVLKETKEE